MERLIAYLWILFIMSLIIAGLVGQVKCIIKAVNCNWEPIDKAEIIYTVAALTTAGCVVGYIDIEDK